MSGRTAFAVIGIAFFAIGLILKLRERKVRVSNVKRKIDSWLRASNFAFREVDEWPNWHFGFQITEPGVRTWVARVKGRGRERYVTFIADIILFSKEGKEAYAKSSAEEQNKLFRKLMIQTAISKTNVVYDLAKNAARINKRIPISPNLIESDFLAAIGDIWFSAQIIWNTISLEIPQKGEVTPPAPKADTEEPPPSEALS